MFGIDGPEGFGIFSGILSVVLLILGILILLIPVFVIQISNSVKRMNRKMDKIITLLEENNQRPIKIAVSSKTKKKAEPKPKFNFNWNFITCKHCGAKNPTVGTLCTKCGMQL